MRLSILVMLTLCYLLCACESTPKKAEKPMDTTKVEMKKNNTTPPKPKPVEVMQLPTVSIKPNEKITSPQQIKVNSEGVWMAMEGELGWIQLVDDQGNELAQGILSTKDDWMKAGPVLFSTALTFDAKNAKKGKIIIHNNSGDGAEAGKKASFEIPVRF